MATWSSPLPRIEDRVADLEQQVQNHLSYFGRWRHSLRASARLERLELRLEQALMGLLALLVLLMLMLVLLYLLLR